MKRRLLIMAHGRIHYLPAIIAERYVKKWY
jgi:hypothetical protein